MNCGDFKDINRRTATDQLLRDKAISITKNPKYGIYQPGLALMVSNIQAKNYSSKLLENLRKKSTLSFIDNIWGVDPVDIQNFIVCY